MDILKFFRAGEVIENPSKWKNIQNLSNAISLVISAIVVILKVFNIDLHLSNEKIIVLSGGIATLLFGINVILTTITSNKVGIIPNKDL